MKEHTKGPWFVVWEEDGDNDFGGNGEFYASDFVAETPDSCDYVDLLSSRNAALIAAAPEMLNALKTAQIALEGCSPVSVPGYRETLAAIRAAIAKATEQPPGQSAALPHGNE